MADRLNTNERLNRDQAITSADDRYKFVMQGDGNLVLYRQSDGRPLWHSGTHGQPATHVIMQADGNLVIKASDGRALWASNTSNHPGAYLIVQNDGNVVIYEGQNPIWATGTDSLSDKPVLVLSKQGGVAATLEQARIRSVGGRQFVVGKEIDSSYYKARFGGAVIWIPLDDVILVAELTNPKEGK